VSDVTLKGADLLIKTAASRTVVWDWV
jgi:hypothetical protein